MRREPGPSEETRKWVRKMLAVADAARVDGGFEMKPLFDAESSSQKKVARDKADPEAFGKDRRGR